LTLAYKSFYLIGGKILLAHPSGHAV